MILNRITSGEIPRAVNDVSATCRYPLLHQVRREIPLEHTSRNWKAKELKYLLRFLISHSIV